MSVQKPEIAPCPLDQEEISGETYFTENQSHLNTSRKDKFLLVFQLPVCFDDINTKDDVNPARISENSVQFTLTNHPTPPISVPSTKQSWGGRSLKLSNHARDSYDPLKISFAVDSKYRNYWTIYKWLDIIASDKDNVYDKENLTNTTPRLGSYSTTLTVYALNEYNQPVAKFVYSGAFPTNLSQMEYDYKNADEMIVSATFEFSFFTMVPLET